MAVGRAAIFLLTALAAAPAWGASERPLLGGRTARFQAAPLTPRGVIKFRGETALASFGDPRCPATSSLRLSTEVGQFTQIDLPCANWRSTTTGYLYKDSSGAAGGVRRIVYRSDRLAIAMNGPGYAPVTAPVPFAEVTFAVGGNRACGRFSAFELNADGRVLASGSQACRPRPNFLVIALDDSRADGIDRMPTVLSRVAAEGTSFTNSFVVESLCAPSRASILTGLEARHHGVRKLSGTFGGAHVFRENGADQQTVAVWLRAAGYDTGLFGKYINGYGESESTLGPGGTFYVPPGWSRWRGMMSGEHYGGVLGPTYQLVDEQGGVTTYDVHATDEQYSTDLLARQARAFIAEAVGQGRNFFAYYTPYASHTDTPDLTPHPAQRHSGIFAFQLPLWRPVSWNEPDVSDKPSWVRSIGPVAAIPGAVNDVIRDLAYESLLAVDEQVGMFLDQLDALGVADDTVVVFTSDNGVAWGEHRLFGQFKECPYEECLRVPMIVRYPRFAAAAMSQSTVLNIDLAPTVAALAGVTPPSAVDGRSYAGSITGQPSADEGHDDFLLERWRGVPDDRLLYSGQPAHGDQVRLLFGDPRADPRAAALFEFDDGSGSPVPGVVPVAIGPTADATFSALGNAIVAVVPETSRSLNIQRHQLTIVDLSATETGVYFAVDRDQGRVMKAGNPVPTFFGVRDVARALTYVEYETDEVELYDLTSDPNQLENVAGDPEYGDERERMAHRLADLLGESDLGNLRRASAHGIAVRALR